MNDNCLTTHIHTRIHTHTHTNTHTHIYIYKYIYIYKQDFALNNQPELICHNQTSQIYFLNIPLHHFQS